MSPQVLTTNATILCLHGGPGTTMPSSNKWTVNGAFVLLEDDTGTIACPFLPNPCTSYQLQSMGLNATEIDSKRVILVTDFNVSNTGLPLTMTESHQCFDDSVPSADLAAALADTSPPVVVAAPPNLAFTLSTQLPAMLIATFTLSSAFPSTWILTFLDGTAPGSRDLTNGDTGVVVTPSGGSWSSSAEVVTVTMTVPFLSTLPAGMHRLYMTGVNQRGLWSAAEIALTVSA
jgi:hypothetical protein